MGDRALQFVSFEGRRTNRALVSATSPEPAVRCRAERDVPVEPGTGLAWRTLSSCGCDPRAYRPRPLSRRVGACLRALGVRNETDARILVEASPEARSRALGAFLISVTGFFRDRAVFDEVQRVVIPSLAARPGRVRAWSAGCANGSELYSLAILLAEAGLLGRSELVGTDCRPGALRDAREGMFGDRCVQAIPADRLARFFDRLANGKWRAAEPLRARASWVLSDITREVEPGPWDMILWRNVAIYLRADSARAIARKLVTTLTHGGFLVLGQAEQLPPGLGVQRVGRSLYQRVEREHVA